MSLVYWFLFVQEESAEAEGHGLHHLYGHPAPAVRLCGDLQPPEAATAHAYAGLPAGRRGGHHRRHVRTGARWVLQACPRGREVGPAGGAAWLLGDHQDR